MRNRGLGSILEALSSQCGRRRNPQKRLLRTFKNGRTVHSGAHTTARSVGDRTGQGPLPGTEGLELEEADRGGKPFQGGWNKC